MFYRAKIDRIDGEKKNIIHGVCPYLSGRDTRIHVYDFC